MFRQKMYDILLDWKSRFQSRTAMLVEGARCVGKSTVVEEFARREYRSYILVDFAEASRDVHELFDDVSDLDYLFLQLQLRYSARLFDRESLIIFDEVQMCLKVRRAIKQLVKDGRYDYIGTGSLVSIRRNTRDILIPREEERAQMRPMDFEEFLWARGDDATVPLLRRAFASRRPLGERLNRRLMRDFRFYMLVGGMPQAVDALLRTNDLRAVDDVKRVIIDLYEEDMHKTARRACCPCCSTRSPPNSPKNPHATMCRACSRDAGHRISSNRSRSSRILGPCSSLATPTTRARVFPRASTWGSSNCTWRTPACS